MVPVVGEEPDFYPPGQQRRLEHPFYDHWDVETSAFASSFLRLFIFEGSNGKTPPDRSWAVGQEDFSRELARLRKHTGYPYASEERSHTAMTRWLAERAG